MKKIITIIGTRPEAIKMASLIKLLDLDKEIEHLVINTGQHQELLDSILKFFDITPKYELKTMNSLSSIETLTCDIIAQLDQILDKEKPDLVLVHGDTTTTFCGAYCSFLKNIQIAHIESGLRTNNNFSPFPEEINRKLVAQLANIHFAPTLQNKQNSLKENIKSQNIFVVGNTVIDSLITTLNKKIELPSEIKNVLALKTKTLLVTMHRRENIEKMQDIFSAINYLATKNSSLNIIFPVHKNPQVVKKIHKYINKKPNIHLIDSLDYEIFVTLLKQVYLVLTDSGGIQEEACFLGIPAIVCRSITERNEGLEAGSLKLIEPSFNKIVNEIQAYLDDQYSEKKRKPSLTYGEGNSSYQIFSILKDYVF